MVVKEVLSVFEAPAASTAVTVASYFLLVLRGLLGTHAEPSSRSSPATALPPESLSVTVVTLPPVTLKPISALTGMPFLPVAGVTLRERGPVWAGSVLPDSGTPAEGAADDGAVPTQAASAGFASSPLQAVSPSGATTTNATTATSERRMPTILDPRSHVPRPHPALPTQRK